MEIVLIVIAVLVIGYTLFRPYVEKDGNKTDKSMNYKYFRKKYFMTAAERDFLKLLEEALAGEYYIFPQVHLSTILSHKVKGQNWKGAFSHINGKSVDFVLCDKQDIKPLVAIELDDSSHDSEARKKRDAIVEAIFEQAKVPLVRFSGLKGLDAQKVSTELKRHL